MIFPIGDDNSDRTVTPYVNYLLLAANILVFIAGLVLVKLFAAGRPGVGPRAAFGRY